MTLLVDTDSLVASAVISQIFNKLEKLLNIRGCMQVTTDLVDLRKVLTVLVASSIVYGNRQDSTIQTAGLTYS
jgi:hypothetical protein